LNRAWPSSSSGCQTVAALDSTRDNTRFIQVELECAFRLLDNQSSGVVKISDVQKFLMQAGKVFTQEEADLFAESCAANANGEMSLADFAGMECWKLPTLKRTGSNTRNSPANVEPQLAGSGSSAVEKKRSTDRPNSASVDTRSGESRVVAEI